MSRRAAAKGPSALTTEMLFAARDYSTAAVMYHNTVGELLKLSVTDLKTLDILERLGPLTAGDIASQTNLATASVTSLIDRLQTRGFVKRSQDPNDRRRVVVNLTPSFEKAVAPLFEPLGRRVRNRFKAYESRELQLIGEFLTSCADDMRTEAVNLSQRDARLKRHRPGGSSNTG